MYLRVVAARRELFLDVVVRPLEVGAEIEGYVVERRVAVPNGPDSHVYIRRDLWGRKVP